MKPEELLAEALPLAKPWGGTGLDGMVFDESVDTEEWARAILAASPRLAAVMELGLAWESAESGALRAHTQALDEAEWLRGEVKALLDRGDRMARYILAVTNGKKPEHDRYAVVADWGYEADTIRTALATPDATTKVKP